MIASLWCMVKKKIPRYRGKESLIKLKKEEQHIQKAYDPKSRLLD